MRPALAIVAVVAAAACGGGGRAHYVAPGSDAGAPPDAAVEPDAGVDAGPALDAGVDSGCHDDLDHDGVDSPACGGRDCDDSDPTIKPRADDPGEWLFESADEVGWAVTPSVAVTADGTAHVLFVDRTAHVVADAVRAGDGSWTRQLVQEGGVDPCAAVAADGQVHAVFVDTSAVPPELRHAVLEGDAWSVEAAVPGEDGTEPLRPSLAAAADGALDVAYAAQGGDGAIVRLATRAGGAWSDEDVALDGGAPEPASGPVALALAGDGAPWLAWEWEGALRVATRSGGVFAVETLPLAGPAEAPAIAWSAASESPAVSYRDRATRALGLARADAGTWSTEVVDDRHGAGAVSALAFDAAGAAHLLYYAPDRFDTRWATDAYGGWLLVTIDRSAEAGLSLVLDGAGADHMAYATSDSDVQWARHVGGDGVDQDCDGLPDDG